MGYNSRFIYILKTRGNYQFNILTAGFDFDKIKDFVSSADQEIVTWEPNHLTVRCSGAEVLMERYRNMKPFKLKINIKDFIKSEIFETAYKNSDSIWIVASEFNHNSGYIFGKNLAIRIFYDSGSICKIRKIVFDMSSSNYKKLISLNIRLIDFIKSNDYVIFVGNTDELHNKFGSIQLVNDKN